MVAAGAADSLLCIKKEDAHIKDTKIKQAFWNSSYEIVFFIIRTRCFEGTMPGRTLD